MAAAREPRPAAGAPALARLLDEIQARREAPPELLRGFVSRFARLEREQRLAFCRLILSEMETGKPEIADELRALLDDDGGDPLRWSRRLTGLRRKMESPRLRAFRSFMGVPGGLKFLLELRAEVLGARADELEPLNEEIAHLFTSWFQRGFLFLQEVTQESPYRLVRFLKEHELVHPLASLEEMGTRLGVDRKCYGLFHRVMPDDPMVFIEVALTRGLARSIHGILQEQAPPADGRYDTAVFYSINNTQNGLAGLGLGKLLIFQVVDAIRADHPDIATFATLSPIPGFWPRYLRPLLEGARVSAGPKARLERCFSDTAKQALLRHHPAPDLETALGQVLSDPGWLDDVVCTRWLQEPLRELAHHYIARERGADGKPLDPVAGFHLGNGASVSAEDVNFGANRSRRGLEDSCGLMVNYLYSTSRLRSIATRLRSLLPWK